MAALLFPDVSNTNGVALDAALAKQEGMCAVSAKASQGIGFVDGLFAANWAAAKAAGLPTMAYHFLDQTGSGQAQAQHFAGVVQTVCGGLGVPLMLDWEADNGQIPAAAVVDDFLAELAVLAPHAPVSVYTAAWVAASAGVSVRASRCGLIWPNYVPGAGNPRQIVAGVTPGWFQPFSGWTAYTARQYTSSAAVANISPCDVNVCFDQAAFDRLFTVTAPPSPKPRPSPKEKRMPPFLARAIDQATVYLVDGGHAVPVHDPADLKVWQAKLAAIGAPTDIVTFSPQQIAALTA